MGRRREGAQQPAGAAGRPATCQLYPWTGLQGAGGRQQGQEAGICACERAAPKGFAPRLQRPLCRFWLLGASIRHHDEDLCARGCPGKSVWGSFGLDGAGWGRRRCWACGLSYRGLVALAAGGGGAELAQSACWAARPPAAAAWRPGGPACASWQMPQPMESPGCRGGALAVPGAAACRAAVAAATPSNGRRRGWTCRWRGPGAARQEPCPHHWRRRGARSSGSPLSRPRSLCATIRPANSPASKACRRLTAQSGGSHGQPTRCWSAVPPPLAAACTPPPAAPTNQPLLLAPPARRKLCTMPRSAARSRCCCAPPPRW